MQKSATTEARAEADAAASAGGLLGLLNIWCRHIALLATWIATCGSLFFSEVLGWQPCLFCWYQRILMYPLAIILTVGILRNDRGMAAYVLPFSIAGVFMSTYHYLLIRAPRFFPPPPCTDGVPCSVDYINWLGFINIPTLALIAFGSSASRWATTWCGRATTKTRPRRAAHLSPPLRLSPSPSLPLLAWPSLFNTTMQSAVFRLRQRGTGDLFIVVRYWRSFHRGRAAAHA
ncbi:disulfide bond formation protein B [Candidatus Gracilibacteria bacterium]|nr:disulfide bond formation protein B [Candidatus Gracilibacteria bacterium]